MRKRKKTRKNSQSYRKYPLPTWFKTVPGGTCRWCNKPVYNDLGQISIKRYWHKTCWHDFLMVTRSNYAKRFVKKRDKGICAKCGKKCRYRHEWHVDHIVALADRPDDNIKWWQLSALQSLCVDCHREKSIEENANRRKRNSEAKKRRKMDK